MKRFVALFLVIIPELLIAQTEVSGNQSGVWNSGGSPYLVTGEIVVPSGQSLMIGPGVEVNFQGHFKFTVNGVLQAVGTEAGMILFTTDTPAVGWGGIRISSPDISELTWCRIEYGKTGGSYPDIHGGGLALLSSDAVVSNCVFADNDATGGDLGMGGAVYAIGTGGPSIPRTRFIDCRFVRNHAYGEGGAIKFTGDMNTEITGCEFIENDCGYGGGAISFYSAAGTKVTRCLFAANYTMFGNGGAMNTLGYGNSIYLVNCTFSGNTAVTGDGGGVNLAYAEACLVNCIVFENPGMYSDDLHLDWGGSAEIFYCDLTMPDGGTGSDNIDEDPSFVDADNLDFRLAEDSPCIDAGTEFFVLSGDTLVNLSPDQYFGDAPDMGRFEFSPLTDAPSEAGTVLKLYRNFPNPFVAGTTIGYRLTEDSHVEVEVFSVTGRKVRTLVDERQVAGSRSVAWNGRNDASRKLSPGIYFLRVKAGGETRGMKMMLSR